MQHEIVESLIKKLSIPAPSAQNIANRKELVFPSHVIGFCFTEMLRHRLFTEANCLFTDVIDSINNRTEEAINTMTCPFWILNIEELLSILQSFQKKIFNRSTEKNYSELCEIIERFKESLEALHLQINSNWLKFIKQKLSLMIIPGLIETEALAGFTSEKKGGLFTRFSSAPAPLYNMTDVMSFLSKIHVSISYFLTDKAHVTQLFKDILELMGIMATVDL